MPTKPRIAIVLSGIQYGGGVPSLAAFLYKELEKNGRFQPTLISLALSARDEHSVRLLSPASWRRGVQVQQGEWGGLPVTFVGAFLTEFEPQRYRPRQALTALLAEYDLIQVVAGTAVLTEVALTAPLANLPLCLYTATSSTQDNASYRATLRGGRAWWSKLMSWRNERAERRLLPQVDRLFVISRYTQELMKTAVNPPNPIFAPPGTDIDIFTPAATYQTDSYLLAVGRLADPRKNSRLLLQMYAQLRQQVTNPPRLRLVGQSPAAAEWAMAESLGITPFIDIFTNVSQEELAEQYRNASLFLLTSDEEGLGIVVIEAMASGLPVVATRCGGTETTIIDGETGYLVPINALDALTNRVQQLWQDPALRRQMGTQGRNRAVAHFSLTATIQPFIDQYEEFLQLTTPSRRLSLSKAEAAATSTSSASA